VPEVRGVANLEEAGQEVSEALEESLGEQFLHACAIPWRNDVDKSET
jgi:hypothetical protein